MKQYTKQEKFNLITFIIAILITSIIMFVFVGQKQGWHEDEIFSYGSSNYRYDNLFQVFSYKDSFNKVMDEKIKDNNIFKMIGNLGYYAIHYNEFQEALNEKMAQERAIWKTSEEAKDYVTLSQDEIFSYWSVYYNQSRDVHPPLFYILVHFASTFSLNHLSKYIIFAINLLFYIGTCFIIRKIMKLFNKDNLSGATVLLYGLSMGAISIVMFQRMYMMLSFFVLSYLYLNLKICRNSFEIDKKTKRWLVLVIVLGFLTQYYFCIYAVFLAIVMACIMLKQKKWKELKTYIWQHIKAAIIGVLIFPASIYHIFFSYRGVAGGVQDTSYILRLKEYMELIFYAFSIPELLGYIIIGILSILFIFKLCKSKRKDIILITCVPIILFTLTIAKIAPFINIRYIYPIFAIIVIAIILLLAGFIRLLFKQLDRTKFKGLQPYGFAKKYTSFALILIIVIIISGYGLATSKPQFLYTEYRQRIELAEQYKDFKLVYVGESVFCHLKDMEEFLRYHNYIIVNTWDLEILKDNEGLSNEKEYILNIKCWISNFDENFNKVLEYTKAKGYELLLDDGESRVYKIYL